MSNQKPGNGPVRSEDVRPDEQGGEEHIVDQGLPLEQAQADRDDLRGAVAGLAGLRLNSVDSALVEIAHHAARAVPGADGAGVTMLEPRRQETVAVTDPFVQAVDHIQYSLGEGPCITAAAEQRTVISDSLGTDQTWPRFGPRARDLDVHSALSLPLLVGGEVVGALNVYARRPGAFDEHAASLGEIFAVPAAVAVHNARMLRQAQRLVSELQTALTSRATIDQAIGILMSRTGATPSDAFARLKETSQHQNVKLATLAGQIVEEAVRRARARHSQP